MYWFCQISKWIRHRYTCVPHPEPSSLLPPHTIPLGRPSAPAPSIQYRVSNLDWQVVSYMILHMFQCHSPKSSHPLIDSLYLVIIFSVLSSISDLSIYIFFSWLLKLFLLHYEIGQLVKICEKKKKLVQIVIIISL